MDIFHFNNQTQEVEVCAVEGYKCSFGSLSKHFTTEAAALARAQKSKPAAEVKAKTTSTSSGTSSSAHADKIKNLTQVLTGYSYEINEVSEIYHHPQGKIIFVSAYGYLKVFKNGMRSSSSATLEKLRQGYGKWQKIEKRDALEAVGLLNGYSVKPF